MRFRDCTYIIVTKGALTDSLKREIPSSQFVMGTEKPDKRDLFVSHATEDREAIARPLARALIDEGFSVWFDEFELKIGDSIRASIDKGLRQSTYGIVILSQNYFGRQWTEAELNGLAAKENNGQKVILPVWHEVDKKFVTEKSPMLADRFAAQSKDGISSIVRMISAVIKPENRNSVRDELESALSSLMGQDPEAIKLRVREQDFDDLKSQFVNVLNGIGFFNIAPSESNQSVFDFVKISILERRKSQAEELLGCLLDWYFQNPTPFSNEEFLKIFEELARVGLAKEVIRKKRMAGLFVAEFGKSHTWEMAAVTTRILVCIQSLLSTDELDRMVNHILTNDQIQSSFSAQEYLEKMLALCDGKVDPAKIREARKKID